MKNKGLLKWMYNSLSLFALKMKVKVWGVFRNMSSTKLNHVFVFSKLRRFVAASKKFR